MTNKPIKQWHREAAAVISSDRLNADLAQIIANAEPENASTDALEKVCVELSKLTAAPESNHERADKWKQIAEQLYLATGTIETMQAYKSYEAALKEEQQ